MINKYFTQYDGPASCSINIDSIAVLDKATDKQTEVDDEEENVEDDELGIVADVGEAELSGDGGEQVIDGLDYPLGFGRHQPSVNADCQVLQQSFVFGHLGLKIRFVD